MKNKNPFSTHPKQVLVFNGSQILIAIVRSLHSTTEFSGGNLQAISFTCTGKYISTGGFYFRHTHPEFPVQTDQIGALKLQEYDELCGEERRYHSTRFMARKRKAKNSKRKIKIKEE